MHKFQIVMTFITPKGNENEMGMLRVLYVNACDGHEMIFLPYPIVPQSYIHLFS